MAPLAASDPLAYDPQSEGRVRCVIHGNYSCRFYRDQLGPQTSSGQPQLTTTMVGRILRNGIRVHEWLRDTPLGPLYRAEDPTGHEVAVVLLGSAADDSSTFGLLRQRCLDAIRIQHPNVAAIHELGETDDGLVYLVAEVLRGEPVSQTLARRGALPLSEAVDVCLQAAQGLQAAQKLGWVHGKVSPETILLTHMDRDRPLVKLTGFSPESLLHRTDADERADVYGLAAVLHQLLTGVPAGTGGTPPEGMRDVLARALDPSPAHRFQTVADFAAALPRPGELVIQQPPQPTSARQHKLARNLWPEEQVVVAVLVAVVVAIGLLWYTYTPGPSAPSRPRLEETGSAAGYQPAISSSAASSPPARLPAKTPSRAPARLPAKAPPAAPAPLSSAAADSLLVDVRSLDPTIQTDMRYATRNNFTGAPLPGYEAPLALLRREGAAALSRVQARLRSQGLGLRVLDAYRPVRASRAMVDWAERTGNRPLIEKGYIPERTRHNLGASVDVTLVDLATGTEVIGTNDFDNFAGTTDTSDATAPALRYRKILVQAMESEGFSQFGRSWWHFNYPVEGAIPLDRVIR